MVMVVSPAPEDLAGMGQAVEYFFVQAFVSELPVEALDESILLRLAGCVGSCGIDASKMRRRKPLRPT